MFTGIITATAKVIAIDVIKEEYLITVEYSESNILKGESIAVDGVSVAVESFNDKSFSFLISNDSFKALNFKMNKTVNIERSYHKIISIKKYSNKVGHFITGKVDQLATVKYTTIDNNFAKVVIGNIDKDHQEYLFPKCLIAINGVSLVVDSIKDNAITMKISSKVIASSNLKCLAPESIVHVEFCIVAKNSKRETVYHLHHTSGIH